MFTNEFGQTVSADWVLLSTRLLDIELLGKVVLQRLTNTGDINLEAEAEVERIDIVVVSEEPGVMQKIDDAIGESSLSEALIRWIFGETAIFHDYDQDGDILIRIDFDDYIRRVHNL